MLCLYVMLQWLSQWKNPGRIKFQDLILPGVEVGKAVSFYILIPSDFASHWKSFPSNEKHIRKKMWCLICLLIFGTKLSHPYRTVLWGTECLWGPHSLRSEVQWDRKLILGQIPILLTQVHYLEKPFTIQNLEKYVATFKLIRNFLSFLSTCLPPFIIPALPFHPPVPFLLIRPSLPPPIRLEKWDLCNGVSYFFA